MNNHPISYCPKALGVRLREWRAQKKWDRKQLARLSGLKPKTIASYETGYRAPSRESLEFLADAFSVAVEELIEGVATVEHAPKPAATGLTTTGRPARSPLLWRVVGLDMASGELRQLSLQLTRSALSSRDAALIQEARQQLRVMWGDRVCDDDWCVVRLSALLAAYAEALAGRAAEAKEHLVLAKRFDTDTLERWRYEVLLELAVQSNANALADVVSEVTAWYEAMPASEPRKMAYHRAMARRAYWSGDFAEAARHYENAFAQEMAHADRSDAWLNVAGAWLEQGDLQAAAVASRKAQQYAIETGLSQHELRARWQQRVIAYRNGERMQPNGTGLIALAEAKGTPRYLGQILLTEATIAWRCKRWALAKRYSAQAEPLLTEAESRRGLIVAGALAIASGKPAGRAELERRVSESLGCDCGEVALQSLALLARHYDGGAGTQPNLVDQFNLHRDVMAMLSEIEPRRWDRTLDVMSPKEACMILDVSIPSIGLSTEDRG